MPGKVPAAYRALGLQPASLPLLPLPPLPPLLPLLPLPPLLPVLKAHLEVQASNLLTKPTVAATTLLVLQSTYLEVEARVVPHNHRAHRRLAGNRCGESGQARARLVRRRVRGSKAEDARPCREDLDARLPY